MTQIIIDTDVRMEHALDPHAVIWVGERDPQYARKKMEESGEHRKPRRTMTGFWSDWKWNTKIMETK